MFDIFHIDLFCDIDQEGSKLVKHFFVFVDDSQGHDGLLEGHILLLSELSGSLDDAHNFGHLIGHLIVDKLLVDVRDKEMVDGWLRLFAVFADDKLHVLVHHVCDIGDNWTHEDVDLEQDIEKDIETHFHVDVVNFSFYSGSVESDIPIGQIL
jgi:hypothetical protein